MAKAGARAVIITARRASSLAETEAAIKAVNSATEVLSISLETTDENSVLRAFETVANKYSSVDVLVNNAGTYGSDGVLLATADISKWWGDFEVNVKGTMLVTRSFLAQLKPDQNASIITLTSGAGFVEVPGGSAYSLTKLVNTKFAGHLAAEHPNVRSVAVHPGIVATDMASGNNPFTPYAHDHVDLPGAVVNWATSEEAAFLQGRYISSNVSITTRTPCTWTRADAYLTVGRYRNDRQEGRNC